MKHDMLQIHGMFLQPSETAATLQRTDWAATPLGPMEQWPSALKLMTQQCLNSAFPMTIGWGPDALIIYNDAHISIMGAKHPWGMGRPALEVYPEIADFLAPAIERVLGHGETLMVKDQPLAMLRGAPGEPLREGYFSISYTPIHDARGKRCGALSTAIETTAAVLQTRRRATTAHLADLLVKHSSASGWVPDIRPALLENRQDYHHVIFYQVHDAGRTVVPIWGYPQGLHRAMRDSPELERALERLSALGEHGHDVVQVGRRTYAALVTHRDLLGNRAMMMLVRPADDVAADQHYEAFLKVVNEVVVGGLLRIVSEQAALAQVRQKLGERDRMYRALFEYSSEAIALLDPKGGIIAANPATTTLLGYNEAELLELDYRTIASRSGSEVEQGLTRLATHGRTTLTARLRRKDGTSMQADISAVQFRDPVAQSDRIITILRDAEARLLNQEQLNTSARMQALGELTGGISHDFNNLLNVIINGTEELLDELPASDPEQRTAQLILEGGLQAADLTRQLLAFSQRRPMQARSVSPAEAVQELVGLLERTLEGGIDLVPVTTATRSLQTDPSQLQNALLNLCLNARDAMPTGGRLWLEARDVLVDGALARERGIDPGPCIEFLVIDEGEGIPAELTDRVVEPFFTTRPDHQGLGLSMVYGYVRQSGGSMRIDSTPGTGTRVQLLLPAAADTLTGRVDRSASAPPVPTDRNQRHLVMVEDNEMLGPMLKRILEQAGYRVSLFEDAASALALITADSAIDALVTDIVLGGDMDGWTLIDRARELRPSVVVIGMSGYAAGQFRRQAADLEVPGLSKPFRPRELLELLERMLSHA